ncbi:MAG: 50S ribosomal protein L3 [Oscillospiraceae bacterium]|nr:50S ribosomal protein L3 [Oscillospiraceae bacterium]
MSRLPAEKGIIGKKLGMTQVFLENGNVIPVTVIEAGPCTVIQKKTPGNDGYSSVQLGFSALGENKEKKAKKPIKGHFKKAGTPVFRHLKEFKLKDADSLNVGDVVKADIFQPLQIEKDANGKQTGLKILDRVDVTGTTKGRGFTGVIKRWGFKKKVASHGVGPVHRHAGSLGANSDPSKIVKNKKMPGHYGHERMTALNLDVVKVDAEKNLLAVHGAVPGPKGSFVYIRSTVK